MVFILAVILHIIVISRGYAHRPSVLSSTDPALVRRAVFNTQLLYVATDCAFTFLAILQVVKKSKAVFSAAGGPPIFFVRALVQLEDSINDTRQDKVWVMAVPKCIRSRVLVLTRMLMVRLKVRPAFSFINMHHDAQTG